MSQPLRLFQGFGVELEYMLVDADTLCVRPQADELIRQEAGRYASEVELGPIAWSNELALHVVELKTNGPAASLDGLAALFQQHVGRMHRLLEPLGARLMPTAMHPWMDPVREMRLWPHEYNPVYEAYHRIFDCRGHGWANLQSVHLNLPFADDDEFGRLHAAIRLLMPIMPALAASSPVVEGAVTGLLDHRLEVYCHNSDRVPSVAGRVIPEPVYTADQYRRQLLQPMYQDIAPLDPQGVLQDEWLNARGAIARFQRNTIEIRVLDVQECPLADLAICAAVVAVLKALTDQRFTGAAEQQRMASEPLIRIFQGVIGQAEQYLIEEPAYLAHFGLTASRASAGDVWASLIQRLVPPADPFHPPLETIVRAGPLARRIVRALGSDPPGRLRRVYRDLCECLTAGRMYDLSRPAELAVG